MTAPASRAELESRLKGVAHRLVARQLARAAFSGLAGAGFGLGLGVLFLDALPRLLLSASAGAVPIAACAAAGFVIGFAYQFRRYSPPTVQDAALALESRLERDTGALGAALRTDEQSAFYRPLLVQAGEDFARADEAPAPVLIPTARLIVVPVIVLASAVAFAWVLSAGLPQSFKSEPTQPGDSAWAPIDIGGERSAEDQAAYRKALGMKETAATLNKAAATLRAADATRDEKSQALNEAREAINSDEAKAAGIELVNLPTELPAGEGEQKALADVLAEAASGMGAAAKKVEEGESATEDTGGVGEFGDASKARELVPFPPQAAVKSQTGEVLAAQTPARREMAKRAVEALEKISNE